MFRFLYCNIIKEERRCRLKDVFYHHSHDSHIKNTGTYLISTKPPLLMVSPDRAGKGSRGTFDSGEESISKRTCHYDKTKDIL